MRTSAIVVLVLAASVAAAPEPQRDAREITQLVEKLGSEDFAEREAATKRLDELGAPALDDLRAACRSEDPEVADRAKDLVRKIERRIASERALAPTVVELTAKNTPLDAVLAALSKQSGYEVVLNGPNLKELAAKKVTVATGKVPFWSAVLKVCDVADLQIGGVGGFVAPWSAAYAGTFAKTAGGTAIRFTLDTDRAVVLESRGAKKRPASVHGAVLVEAFVLPLATPDSGATLVQFWPEPKLAWQSVANLKITKATAGDRTLTPDPTPPPAPGAPRIGKLRVVVNDGTSSTIMIAEGFQPNVRQAVVKFKPDGAPAGVAGELTGSASALVRTGPEALATVTLDPKGAVAVTGRANVELTASAVTEVNGKKFVEVAVFFPPTSVDPVGTFDALPDVKPAAAGDNRAVLGVRVTDADGTAFPLSLTRQRSDYDKANRRTVARMTLELVAAKDGPTKPAKVTFWGRAPRPVEVPFTLKDVPLR
jgi:hypothetical protein